MRTEQNWAFRFCLICETRSLEECENIADRVLSEIMTPWAEERNYGIGGGFACRDTTGPEFQVEFIGGLAATHPEQMIPDAHAEELMKIIRDSAIACGMRVEGGWREYTAEEGLPIPELPE